MTRHTPVPPATRERPATTANPPTAPDPGLRTTTHQPDPDPPRTPPPDSAGCHFPSRRTARCVLAVERPSPNPASQYRKQPQGTLHAAKRAPPLSPTGGLHPLSASPDTTTAPDLPRWHPDGERHAEPIPHGSPHLAAGNRHRARTDESRARPQPGSFPPTTSPPPATQVRVRPLGPDMPPTHRASRTASSPHPRRGPVPGRPRPAQAPLPNAPEHLPA